MRYVMHLNDEPFQKIKDGSKTIELRLNDEKRRKIAKNDEILFICGAESLMAEVQNIYVFKNFEEAYHLLDFFKFGYTYYDVISYHDMEKYYSKEDIEKYGVVCIEISLVK